LSQNLTEGELTSFVCYWYVTFLSSCLPERTRAT